MAESSKPVAEWCYAQQQSKPIVARYVMWRGVIVIFYPLRVVLHIHSFQWMKYATSILPTHNVPNM